MLNKKSIVFLYSEGLYDSSVKATIEYMTKMYKDIYLIDISDDATRPFKVAKLSKKTYVFSSRNMPWINHLAKSCNLFFAPIKIKKSKKDYKEFKKPNNGFQRYFYNMTAKYRRVHNIIARFDPEIVICSTPELLKQANKSKSDLAKVNLSVCGLITDYTLNKNFVHFKTDYYYVQNENVKQGLINFGIEDNKISVIGTPILKDEEKYDRKKALTEFNIDNENKNIALIGGRYGSESLKNIFNACFSVSEDINLVVVTGGSSALTKYCTYIAKTKKKDSGVYLVENTLSLAMVFSIADIIICAPTATITFEAMCNKKPIIVLKGNDKIEKGNAHFITSNNLGLRGDNPDDVITSLDKFLTDKSFCETVRLAQVEFAGNDCAMTFGDLLYDCATRNHNAKMEVEKKRKTIISTIETTKTEITTRAKGN